MIFILHRLRVLVAILLASLVGTLPACGTMGGGGMKSLFEYSQAQDLTGA